jgi:hypothetical protein
MDRTDYFLYERPFQILLTENTVKMDCPNLVQELKENIQNANSRP